MRLQVPSARSPAGRVYKLRNHSPSYTGWITYADTLSGHWCVCKSPQLISESSVDFNPTASFPSRFNANGTEDEAVLVRVEPTDHDGEYVLVNCGKANHPITPTDKSYISFASAGMWVHGPYARSVAITVKLLAPGTPGPPPPPPAPPTPPTPTPCRKKFDFRRLGLRTAGMLISPYIPAGAVFQEPVGPYPDSQFDLSSLCSTAKHLFGLPGFLTQRDAWAGSFHELLSLETPRTDAPLHLPDGPPLAAEREERRRQWRRLLAASSSPDDEPEEMEAPARHCSPAKVGECAEMAAVTTKQKNQMKWMAEMVHMPAPSKEALRRMTKREAGVWLQRAFSKWWWHNDSVRKEEVAAGKL